MGKKLVAAILTGLVLGGIAGPLLKNYSEELFYTVDEYFFSLVGDLFLQSITMLVIPIIFISLVVGTAGIGNPKQLGRMGIKTLILYLVTTIIAISVGLTMGNLFQPGIGIERSFQADEVSVEEDFSMIDTVKSIVPENPFAAMAEGNVLATIFMALFVGAVLASNKKALESFMPTLEHIQQLLMDMMRLVMHAAPIGVFGLMASAIGEAGSQVVRGMLYYSVLVTVGILVQMAVVYVVILVSVTRQNPFIFYRKIMGAMLIGFSTSSSSASLPVTLETVGQELGVHNDVASFVVPLGATLNMDGTALVQGLATIFIAQAYGIDLALGEQLTVILMATTASIGTAGVPGVGIIMLAMILRSVNLPVEGIGLVVGVDRILDMIRSAKNIAGDAVVAMVIGKSENKLDLSVFK